MAIVISGVNNNDKITASDGTIDLLSGVNYAGIITAPAFTSTGNITAASINVGSGIQVGNAGIITATTLIGNVTGNINHTSNLLLQISGSEKFRVASSGQLGIGGANYGTSGQVLTSGGSGSAATWSTIASDKITEGNTEAEVVDTGSDGHFKVTTEGSERLRIDSNGSLLINGTTSFDSPVKLQVRGASSALSDGGQIFDVATTATATGGTRLAFGVNEDNYSWIRSYESGVGSRDLVFAGVSEHGRFDSSGRLLIGTTSHQEAYGTSALQIAGTSGATSSMSLIRHGNSPYLTLGSSGGSSLGAVTALSSGDRIGQLTFAGADGTDINTHAASIAAYVDGSVSSNNVPARIVFATGPSETERIRITSEGFVGIGEDDPQTKLDVRGTISTGRNVARELGTVINISSQYIAARGGSNVINGNKNFEAGGDWLTASSSRTNANLTIDLGTAVLCDRFVIYNQNEYDHSNREVKNFTLEGSNDNSSWTTILDDDCGCSQAHEPNPGFSFRIPEGNIYGVDDSEGTSYRYWKFTMKTFHGTDASGHGGVMELELYEQSQTIHATSEICTHSLVAGDISTQRMNGIQMLTSSEGLNIHTGEDASDTWEITETGIVTSGSYTDKSTIRHKRGVAAFSSTYNSGDLYVRIDNIYNLPGNAWWTFSAMIISSQVEGGLGGHHSYVTSLNFTGLSSWSSVSKTDIVGSCSVSVSSHGSNFIELQFDFSNNSRGPNTFICNGGTFDPPRISFH